MSGHTPGPWKYVPPNPAEVRGNGWIDASGPHSIGQIYRGSYDQATEESHANGRLIAAAPDLLVALQNIIEIGKRDLSNPKYDGYFQSAREAIAKAEGRS